MYLSIHTSNGIDVLIFTVLPSLYITYKSGLEMLKCNFDLKKMASTLFIVSITTHNKSLVKTIVRSAFRNFYPGISYCVQENEEYANIMLKTTTKQ
jgi:hypothetical protein